jgi:hypothetical protein
MGDSNYDTLKKKLLKRCIYFSVSAGRGQNMRHYLYILQVDRGKLEPIELFIIYALDDVDAMKKARKQVADHRKVEMMLKKCQGHFTTVHREYPPYIDTEDERIL